MADRLTLARHENVATKSDLQATETALRTELRSEVAALRTELALVEHRLLTRLGSMVVAATGILIAIPYVH